MAAIVLRQGPRAFREHLLRAYGGRCAITGCDLVDVLEAAHIYPDRGDQTDDVSNGLLLRADIHTLFDLGLIAVDTATYRVLIAKRLVGTVYEDLSGRPLALPARAADRPSPEALYWHREDAGLNPAPHPNP